MRRPPRRFLAPEEVSDVQVNRPLPGRLDCFVLRGFPHLEMPHRIQNLAAAHEDRAQAGSEQQIARQAGIGGEIMRAALDCAKRQRIDHRTGFKACADLEQSEKASEHRSKSSKFQTSGGFAWRSEEHTSELQSLMRISYAVFCLKKTTPSITYTHVHTH